MHEAMHLAFALIEDEEEMITFAENEAYKIIDKINHEIKTTQNKQQ